MHELTVLLATGLLACAVSPAFAREHSMGKPVVTNGLILHPAYL